MLIVLMIALYFLPSIIAAVKEKKNGLSIFLLNFLVGWTVVGWIIALVWATTND